MQQHLGRQSGVQKVEVSLLDGKVQITPKDDGQIDPAQLLKATYDSGVTVAEMDVVARGQVVKDPAGGIALQVAPDRIYAIAPNDLSKSLEALSGTAAQVTVRAQLYTKPAGKRKADQPAALKLTVLEVQKDVQREVQKEVQKKE